RDFGLDFRWYDRFAENWYARGFTGTLTDQYALVTAFEVLEHFAGVRQQIAQLFGLRADLILVGTVLHESPSDDWWYYTPQSGQHIAFYSPITMRHIAERHDYEAYI